MNQKALEYSDLSGPQKAAIFLLAMGEEYATEFFRGLDESNIKSLGQHMSTITYIPSETLESVMGEFVNNFENDVDLAVSGREFLQQVVNKTLDKETAREVFKVIGEETDAAPFTDLAFIPAESLMNIIKGEHPQTIALILSYLPNEKAAEVMGLLPDEIKPDIAVRIANIGTVQEDLVHELDQAIKKDLSGIGTTTRKFDGVEKLADILNEVDSATEESVIARIEKEDGDLAEAIRQKMFIFEDLEQVENKSFRDILQNISNDVVVKAIKTASEEMKQKIFGNLSERAAEMLKEDFEAMGPLRLRDVEEAQQQIIRVAKKLEAEGRIVLGGKGGEDVFV
jgi:flagellar motor switch protein FliG